MNTREMAAHLRRGKPLYVSTGATHFRIYGARTRKSAIEVRKLNTGRWVTVAPGAGLSDGYGNHWTLAE